MRLVKTVN